jgi:hypothetical protein
MSEIPKAMISGWGGSNGIRAELGRGHAVKPLKRLGLVWMGRHRAKAAVLMKGLSVTLRLRKEKELWTGFTRLTGLAMFHLGAHFVN